MTMYLPSFGKREHGGEMSNNRFNPSGVRIPVTVSQQAFGTFNPATGGRQRLQIPQYGEVTGTALDLTA